MLLSQAFTRPSGVLDVATGLPAAGFTFHYPAAYLLFAPFSSLADTLTVMGAQRLAGVVALVLMGCFFFFRSWKARLLAVMAWSGFLVWGALAPRPMARLLPQDPDTLLVDFHSHTNRSHDGRKSFTPEKNAAWHRLQGYGASFMTDHNVGGEGTLGEEVSLHNTHLIVLGTPANIDNTPYDGDPLKVAPFIREMRQKGFLVIASLPEYWEHHWGAGLSALVEAGISGFEVISGAPKALDFPHQEREKILALCREKGLLITGISDNHGYGSATPAWNAVKVPNWPMMKTDALEKTILDQLRRGGFSTVQVLERDPIFWLTMSPWQAVSWVGWIWIFAILFRNRIYG